MYMSDDNFEMINTDEMRKIIKVVEEVRQSVLARCVYNDDLRDNNNEEIRESAAYSIQDFLTNLCVDNPNTDDPNLSAHSTNEEQVYTGNG